MSGEEILITHDDYTDTSYVTCGTYGCTLAVMRSIGASEKDAADYLNGKIHLDATTTVEVVPLGESDSCAWCATCGEFIRHGIIYVGGDVGCQHPVNGDDPGDLPGPHIDLVNAPAMVEYWGTGA